MNDKPIAEVLLSCGRYYLSVAGISLAIEGETCREGNLPDQLYDTVPEEEFANATIGGRPIRNLNPAMVRVFRGSLWNKEMLEYVADRINQRAR
jgi:hypothetical protein